MLTVSQSQNNQSNNITPVQTESFQLRGHTSGINAICYSNSGILASGDQKGDLFLWDTSLPPQDMNIGSYNMHKNEILDLAWLSSTLLVSCGADNNAIVYDTESQKVVRTYRHSKPVNSVAVSFQGNNNLIITGSDNGFVRVWDLRSKQSVHEISTPYPITAVACDSNMNNIYTGGIDPSVKCFDMRLGKLSFQLHGHTDMITSLSLSNDNTLLLSYATDGAVRSWDIRPVVSEERKDRGRAIGIYAGSPVPQRSIGSSNDTLSPPPPVLSRVKLICNNAYIGTSGLDGMLYLFKLSTYELVSRLPGHTGPLSSFDYNPHTQQLATCSLDKTIIVGKVLGA